MTSDKEKDAQPKHLGWTVIHFGVMDYIKTADECIATVEKTISKRNYIMNNNYSERRQNKRRLKCQEKRK